MKAQYFMIFIYFLLLSSCSEHGDPDPQKDFEGTFKMEQFQCRIEPQDPGLESVFVIKTYPNINFTRSDVEDEMEVRLDEFILSIMDAYIEVNNKAYTIAIESHEPFPLHVAGQEFRLDSAGFNMKYTNPYAMGNIESSISLHGNLKNGLLNMEFMLSLKDETEQYFLTGTGAANKDEI